MKKKPCLEKMVGCVLRFLWVKVAEKIVEVKRKE